MLRWTPCLPGRGVRERNTEQEGRLGSFRAVGEERNKTEQKFKIVTRPSAPDVALAAWAAGPTRTYSRDTLTGLGQEFNGHFAPDPFGLRTAVVVPEKMGHQTGLQEEWRFA